MPKEENPAEPKLEEGMELPPVVAKEENPAEPKLEEGMELPPMVAPKDEVPEERMEEVEEKTPDLLPPAAPTPPEAAAKLEEEEGEKTPDLPEQMEEPSPPEPTAAEDGDITIEFPEDPSLLPVNTVTLPPEPHISQRLPLPWFRLAEIQDVPMKTRPL
jgi:hypothetical protein